MLANSYTERDKCLRIDFKSYTNDSLSLYFEALFSIVWIEYYGRLTINFESYELNGHYLLFLCPEELLEVKNYGRCAVITIPNNHDMVASINFMNAFGNITKYSQLKDFKFLKTGLLFNSIQHLVRDNNKEKETENKISEIVQFRTEVGESPNNKGWALVYHFISLMHKNYKMHHEMSFYAKNLITSAKSITENFHLLGIMPPGVYIKKRILSEAKRQLTYTDKMIKIICFDLGFNDPAYFARFFKKHTGMTCNQFRKLHRSD